MIGNKQLLAWSTDLETITTLLKNSGVIVYPTETVYGLGGNALDRAAVEKIFQVKQRDPDKPLIVLVRDTIMAQEIVELGTHQKLLSSYWPGALTGIFPTKKGLPAGVLSKKNTVAVRVSPHPFVRELFDYIDFPLISTSANKSGEANCRTLTQVKESLGEKSTLVDAFVDWGELPLSLPSTVVDFTVVLSKVVREGAVKFVPF